MVFLVGLVAGCTEEPPSTPVPTRISASATPQPEPIRTLPPTWTLTNTWTPRPPTLTPTITPTSTITPSPDPAQVCEMFDLFAAPTNGSRIDYDGRIAFSWQNALPNAEIRISILNRETDAGLLVRWPSQQSLNMPVEMTYLPSSGRYDWQLTIHDEELGELCPVEGWFVRKQAGVQKPHLLE